MLALLQKGVIKLKDGVDVVKATVKDVVENPKNLKFKTDVEPGLSPKLYENNEEMLYLLIQTMQLMQN